MTIYYEIIMELWEAGKFFDAIKCFGQSIPGGSLSREEIGSFNQNLAKFWQLIEVECEQNAEVLFSLYQKLKGVRNWDDKTSFKRLKTSDRAVEDIKARRKTRSKAAGLRMLYELFPQMAV